MPPKSQAARRVAKAGAKAKAKATPKTRAANGRGKGEAQQTPPQPSESASCADERTSATAAPKDGVMDESEVEIAEKPIPPADISSGAAPSANAS